MTERLQLVAEPLDAPRAAAMLEQLVAELQVRYDDEGAGGAALVPAAFAAPTGRFLVALYDGEPVGCGGLRRHADGIGEVKRMYVVPAARGNGVGRAVLAALEDRAVDLGYRSLLLETGTAQPEAVALYERAGWSRVPPYGEWRHSPCSICFGRELRRAERSA